MADFNPGIPLKRRRDEKHTMKTWQMLVIAGMTTSTAMATIRGTATIGCVAVQVRMKSLVSIGDWVKAEYAAGQVFSNVGVQINWEGFSSRERNASCIAVRIELDPKSTRTSSSDALAYALPYQAGGTQIYVSMDRIMAYGPGTRAVVLGYAITHEIAHVLEGINRHSAEGVMKASWTGRDYCAMRRGSFGFAAEDIELIRMRFSKMEEQVMTSAHQ
jgi:hypothetical protein